MRALLSSITLDMLEHDRFKRIPVLLILFTYAITIFIMSKTNTIQFTGKY